MGFLISSYHTEGKKVEEGTLSDSQSVQEFGPRLTQTGIFEKPFHIHSPEDHKCPLALDQMRISRIVSIDFARS
ncbi:hypothetical protein ABIF69_003019 [Bradyrhizobium japonicum]